MYELGYAAAKRGQENLVMIANTDTAQTADLSFDIRNRLMILRKFDIATKPNIIAELAAILSGSESTINLDSPYINPELSSYSPQSGVGLVTHSNEPQNYLLESISMGDTTAMMNQNLAPNTMTRNITVSTITLPFEASFETISFIVSRGSNRFRIVQNLTIESRADGKFNLNHIEQRPLLD